MTKSSNIFNRIDWVIVLLYIILVFFGWINIYSSVYNEQHQSVFDLTQRHGKQLLWIAISVIIIVAIFLVESHIIASLSFFIYGFMILLLVSVLVFGVEVNHSRSWFQVGNFKMQPAEFAKFALSLAVARFMSHEKFKFSSMKSVVILTGIIILPALLILLQNDTGSALVYSVFILVLYRFKLPFIYPFLVFLSIVLFVMSFKLEFYIIFLGFTVLCFLLYYFLTGNYINIIIATIALFVFNVIGFAIVYVLRSNVSINLVIALSIILLSIGAIVLSFRKQIFEVVLIASILIGSIFYTFSVNYIFYNFLGEYQQTRILITLGEERDDKDKSYNVNQSKIAIGSGGLYGAGFLQGTQTKFNFVPEQDTDFIYCTVGEEWGFVGTSTVLLLFLFLVLRIIYLAEKQKSLFSRIYGYAVALILFFHFGINIAMTIGLAPVIGIPLPFFSYGGSSLWSFTILLFIFVRLNTDRESLL